MADCASDGRLLRARSGSTPLNSKHMEILLTLPHINQWGAGNIHETPYNGVVGPEIAEKRMLNLLTVSANLSVHCVLSTLLPRAILNR